jgi:hypothetical protein
VSVKIVIELAGESPAKATGTVALPTASFRLRANDFVPWLPNFGDFLEFEVFRAVR